MEEKKIQPSKIEAVAAIKESLEGKKGYIFADYRGLTVEKITELRNSLRDKGAEFRVVKNNYAKIALKDLGVDGVEDFLVGPTAIALVDVESGPVAKELVNFAKDNPVSLRGAYVDGQIMKESELEAFSKLPTKDELYAMLMSTAKAPVQNMVFALSGITTKLVRTLDAVRASKES